MYIFCYYKNKDGEMIKRKHLADGQEFASTDKEMDRRKKSLNLVKFSQTYMLIGS